ncbi:CsbD-like [Streptomyces sp. 2131.1]|nr:CsbD-like [Streptomyces sp. 2131.1]
MKNEGAKDKITGKAKEAMGKMTGDRRKEAEGKSDQAKGKTKDAMDGARDRAGGLKDSLSDDKG